MQFKSDQFSNLDEIVDDFTKSLTIAGFINEDEINLIEQFKALANSIIETCTKSVELCDAIDNKDIVCDLELSSNQCSVRFFILILVFAALQPF